MTKQDIQSRTLYQLLQEKDFLVDIFEDGKYNLIPTFFKTMLTLKRQKREFAVVFRSFHTDSINIIREFNKFC